MYDTLTVRTVDARGTAFAVAEAGDPSAPLALCLHGFPDCADTFTALLGTLGAAGWHAVAPWMRGYHPTGPAPDGRYQSAALALDALALVEALSPDGTAALVGHDWGAAAAVGAAALRPEAVRSVVSLAVPHPAVWAEALTGDVEQMKRSWYMFLFQLPGIAEAVLSAGDFALVERLWREWSPGFRPPATHLDAVRRALRPDGCVEAALGYYRHSLDVRLQADDLAGMQVDTVFGRLRVPALFAVGEDDGCILPDLAARSPAMCDGPVRVERLPGCGHFLHLERPEAVAALVHGWIGPPQASG